MRNERIKNLAWGVFQKCKNQWINKKNCNECYKKEPSPPLVSKRVNFNKRMDKNTTLTPRNHLAKSHPHVYSKKLEIKN